MRFLHLRPTGHGDRPMASETCSFISVSQAPLLSHSLIFDNIRAILLPMSLLLRPFKIHSLLTMYLLTLFSLFLFPGARSSQLPNFWLAYMKLDSYDPHYRHQAGGVFTTPSGDPNWACDHATYNSGIWEDRDDVSGGKLGMRCDPSRDVGFPLYRDPLEVVEFNTGKFWAGHQTVYSDRDYGLYDLDDRKTAQCYVNRSVVIDLECEFDGRSYTIKGSTMFHCEALIEQKGVIAT
ncbi:hypothetical protein F5B21DRAFT_519251 [Xylaria acuta]|nr:hypothetical protein F5B21DRAFT_519251 [Xylaria acuta]